MSENRDKYFFGTSEDNMSIEEYLKRINDITEYYNERGEKYKKEFYYCCYTRLVASALIPVISLASQVNWSTVIVSILAGLITITEGYVNVSRSYEKWTKYRETCNSLWLEQRAFAMKVGIYANDSDRVQNFVERCEGFMMDETSEWKKYIERAKEMK